MASRACLLFAVFLVFVDLPLPCTSATSSTRNVQPTIVYSMSVESMKASETSNVTADRKSNDSERKSDLQVSAASPKNNESGSNTSSQIRSSATYGAKKVPNSSLGTTAVHGVRNENPFPSAKQTMKSVPANSFNIPVQTSASYRIAPTGPDDVAPSLDIQYPTPRSISNSAHSNVAEAHRRSDRVKTYTSYSVQATNTAAGHYPVVANAQPSTFALHSRYRNEVQPSSDASLKSSSGDKTGYYYNIPVSSSGNYNSQPSAPTSLAQTSSVVSSKSEAYSDLAIAASTPQKTQNSVATNVPLSHSKYEPENTYLLQSSSSSVNNPPSIDQTSNNAASQPNRHETFPTNSAGNNYVFHLPQSNPARGTPIRSEFHTPQAPPTAYQTTGFGKFRMPVRPKIYLRPIRPGPIWHANKRHHVDGPSAHAPYLPARTHRPNFVNKPPTGPQHYILSKPPPEVIYYGSDQPPEDYEPPHVYHPKPAPRPVYNHHHHQPDHDHDIMNDLDEYIPDEDPPSRVSYSSSRYSPLATLMMPLMLLGVTIPALGLALTYFSRRRRRRRDVDTSHQEQSDKLDYYMSILSKAMEKSIKKD